MVVCLNLAHGNMLEIIRFSHDMAFAFTGEETSHVTQTLQFCKLLSFLQAKIHLCASEGLHFVHISIIYYITVEISRVKLEVKKTLHCFNPVGY